MKNIIWFSILLVVSMTIVLIVAIMHPNASDFNNTAITLIFISGIIFGIAVGIGFKKDKKEIITQ